MLKGVQTRRSIHIILCALKNNKDVFENILNKEIIKYKYSSKDINLIQAVVLESIRFNNQATTIIICCINRLSLSHLYQYKGLIYYY